MLTAVQQLERIQRACAGDRAALQQLLWDHYDRLVGYLRPRVSANLNRLVAIDDIVQETFIHAIRSIGSCQATTEQSFAAWLASIADHRLHDILKTALRRKRGGDRRRIETTSADSAGAVLNLIDLISDREVSPGRMMARHEAVLALQVGIAGLPDDQREAIRLRYLEGKSIEETARRLGRTSAAVNGLVRRAKEALRGTLQDSSRWLSERGDAGGM